MRILNLLNQDAGRCGIANFARQVTTALTRAGAEVAEWNANYSEIYRRREAGEPYSGYFPPDLPSYDAVFLGWHPGAMNHYTEDHFRAARAAGVVTAVYLHDIPPWSGCPLAGVADVLFSAEPWHPDCHVIPYPVIDWVGDLPPANPDFTVGWSGVRGDGLEDLREICEQRGWELNASDPGEWLSIEDEVRRLARSSVNVCWYREGRGISGAASTCLASGRPLLVNHSPMLAHLRGAPDVYCFEKNTSLDAAMTEVWARCWGLAVPVLTKQRLGWEKAAVRMVGVFEAALGRRRRG